MNRAATFDPVAKTTHWLTAFAVLFLIVLGTAMTDGDWTPDLRRSLFAIHKSVGFFVLLLSLFRLVWRRRHRPPPFPVMPLWQVRTALAVHAGLYALMLLVPCAGLGYVATAQPALREAHEALVSLLAVLIVVHIGATLLHHFVERDDVLLRVSPTCLTPWLNRLRGL